MDHRPTVILPIRDFGGLSRLDPVLDSSERSELSRSLVTQAVTAAHDACLDIAVLSASDDVASWADEQSLRMVDDPGGGLSSAAAHAVSIMGGRPWIMLHADLPLVTGNALTCVAAASALSTVLIPSHDGGTNVIASTGPFPFSYGVGSFHRHFAAAPDARIIVMPELSIDIDTPQQLSVFPGATERPSL
ncbi:MAG: NTP transferase domain-containing protein [Actinomycetota bacterium]